jgi:hypothetical protein
MLSAHADNIAARLPGLQEQFVSQPRSRSERVMIFEFRTLPIPRDDGLWFLS